MVVKEKRVGDLGWPGNGVGYSRTDVCTATFQALESAQLLPLPISTEHRTSGRRRSFPTDDLLTPMMTFSLAQTSTRLRRCLMYTSSSPQDPLNICIPLAFDHSCEICIPCQIRRVQPRVRAKQFTPSSVTFAREKCKLRGAAC